MTVNLASLIHRAPQTFPCFCYPRDYQAGCMIALIGGPIRWLTYDMTVALLPFIHCSNS
jgi:hypothetical protein